MNSEIATAYPKVSDQGKESLKTISFHCNVSLQEISGPAPAMCGGRLHERNLRPRKAGGLQPGRRGAGAPQ